MVSIATILLMGGCFEKTSDEVKELDPRFVELPASTSDAGTSGVQQNLLDTLPGEKLKFSFDFSSETPFPIDVDIRRDSGENLGKWMLPGPGEIIKEVPAGLGSIQIQAFQDLTGDGPSDDDPFGWVDLMVLQAPQTGIEVTLKAGGKEEHAKLLGHVGGAMQISGPSVQLTIEVKSDFNKVVDLDFRGPEGLVYKASLNGPGRHELSVPASLGEVQLQAFQDLTQDGPSDDDPFGWVGVLVGESDFKVEELELKSGAKLELANSMGHGEVAQAGQVLPFADYTGEWTLLRGVINSESKGPVQVDFRVPDAKEPGGNRFLGRSLLPDTGAYQLQIPRKMGFLILEVFQDPGNDGPSDDDPYATVQVEVKDVESLDQDFQLKAGVRGQPAMESSEASIQPDESLPTQSVFKDLGKNPVVVSGELVVDSSIGEVDFIDLDLFTADPKEPGGRRYLGKLKQKPGKFSFSVPRNFGEIQLDALVDKDADGPTPGDPFGQNRGSAIVVKDQPVTDVMIEIKPR